MRSNICTTFPLEESLVILDGSEPSPLDM